MADITITGTVEAISEARFEGASYVLTYTIAGYNIEVKDGLSFAWSDEAEKPLRITVGETVEVTARERREKLIAIPPFRSAEAFRRVA